MEVVDFMICTGELSMFNYVLVKNTPDNIKILKEMGCTDKEISQMSSDEDNYTTLNVYNSLKRKGYEYVPSKGVFELVNKPKVNSNNDNDDESRFGKVLKFCNGGMESSHKVRYDDGVERKLTFD